MKRKLIRHFTVNAARESGDWDNASLTETDPVDVAEFDARKDTDDVHYDCFTFNPNPDADGYVEECAVTVTFVD